MWARIPYRYRVPIQVTLIVVVTAVVFTLSLGWENYRQLRHAVTDSARLLASTYARALIEPLKHRDVWRGYTLIESSSMAEGDMTPWRPALVLVLDAAGRTFVSTRPRDYPIALAPWGVPAGSAQGVIQTRLGWEPMTLVREPVLDGGGRLGQVLLFLPRTAYLSQIRPLAGRVGLITLGLLALLAPLGWLAGRRLSEPLSNLYQCLERLEREGPRAASCELHEGAGELGRVGRRLRGVLDQLQEKSALEQQMIDEERLAAIGRLSAGVAHEVNNPLAGMLTALDTFKHHGNDPAVARETLDLLERGLHQIRHTVSALLVQSRLQDRPLDPADLDDVRALLSNDMQKKGIAFTWHCDVGETLPLPAADVRQILVNLLLNAVQAAPEGGMVGLATKIGDGHLSIDVCNEGEPIPEQERDRIFEPFSSRSGGTGLGLWVTAQLVHALEGEIRVTSDRHWTHFLVILPLEESFSHVKAQ